MFGVSSYSSHILFIIPFISSSSFVFLTSIFTICDFKSSITLNLAVISTSWFSNFLFFSILCPFSSSILFPLCLTSCLIFSIFCFVCSIVSSSSLLLSLISDIWFVLFSILFLVFSMSKFILSSISCIELSLSSNDDTEIFKFVISKFKSSIYFWLSLLSSANSVIILFNSSIWQVNVSICLIYSCFLVTKFFLFTSISCPSCFTLFSLFSIFWIFSSISSNFCFFVAYSISISCNCFSKFCASSKISSIEFSYSSFSSFNFSTFSFSFFICFSKPSISLPLPKIFTVFLLTEPPVIAPDGLIKSPSSVIILNE